MSTKIGKRKKTQQSQGTFLQEQANKMCCYCGGVAETVDHFPPRCFFDDNEAPEDYWFPACKPCNASLRAEEQVLAVLFRVRLDKPTDERTYKLMRGVRNNNPEYFEEWISLGPVAQKREMREMYGLQGDALRHRGFKVGHFGEKTTAMLARFCIKIGQALYFKHTGNILSGEVFWHIVPVAALNSQEVQQLVSNFDGIPSIKRAKNLLHLQFFYKYFKPESNDAVFSVVQFGMPQILFFVSAVKEGGLNADIDMLAGGGRSGFVGPVINQASLPENASLKE